MIIIMTTDERFREWVADRRSNADSWGAPDRVALVTGPGQRAADRQLQQALSAVRPDEPLCLYAHGNDHSIGDPGTGAYDLSWDTRQLARALAAYLPEGYQGPILIQACAATVANVAPRVALELECLQRLCGVWLYSYHRAIPIHQRFPEPARLYRSVELQGAQVDC